MHGETLAYRSGGLNVYFDLHNLLRAHFDLRNCISDNLYLDNVDLDNFDLRREGLEWLAYREFPN